MQARLLGFSKCNAVQSLFKSRKNLACSSAAGVIALDVDDV